MDMGTLGYSLIFTIFTKCDNQNSDLIQFFSLMYAHNHFLILLGSTTMYCVPDGTYYRDI